MDYMQMEKWSVLSGIFKYNMISSQFDIMKEELRYQNIDMKLKCIKKLHESERKVKEMHFHSKVESVKCKHLDIFEGVRLDTAYTVQYNENGDIGTTYLGMSNMKRQDGLKAEHKISITNDCYIQGKLLYDTDWKVLLDMGACKSFISKTFYFNSPSLHTLHKLISGTKNIFVGNGQYVGVLCFIPVEIDSPRHRFEVYSFVSEIHDNVDMMIGIKKAYEIEGLISTRNSCMHSLNISIPFFSNIEILLKPKEQRFIQMDVPFMDEISGLTITKLLNHKLAVQYECEEYWIS